MLMIQMILKSEALPSHLCSTTVENDEKVHGDSENTNFLRRLMSKTKSSFCQTLKLWIFMNFHELGPQMGKTAFSKVLTTIYFPLLILFSPKGYAASAFLLVHHFWSFSVGNFWLIGLETDIFLRVIPSREHPSPKNGGSGEIMVSYCSKENMNRSVVRCHGLGSRPKTSDL